MGYAYADRSTAPTVAPPDVPEDVSGTAIPPEDDDDPLGWFVSLLIEANATDG